MALAYHSGLLGTFGILLLFTGSIFSADPPKQPGDENGTEPISRVPCGEAEQLLNSQTTRIDPDAGTILVLLESEYACNQRGGARQVAAVLIAHSGNTAWRTPIVRGGQIAAAAGDFETAENLLEAVRKVYANQAELYFELGSVQLQAGEFARANESYQRASQLAPSVAEVQLGLAGARALSGYGEDALAGLDQAIQTFPHDPRFLIAYADVLQQLPEYSEPVYRARAKRYLERAISADNTSAKAHYLLGQLLMTESNLSEALRQFETAVGYEPGFKEAHFALSRAYRKVGRAADAEEQFSLFRKLEALQSGASAAGVP
jgi:tetratricopeptide (TPR) repeat protein